MDIGKQSVTPVEGDASLDVEAPATTGSTSKGAVIGAVSSVAVFAALMTAGISTDAVLINDGSLISAKTIATTAIQARQTDVASITPGSAASRMGILADTTLRSNPHKRDSLMAVAYRKDSLDNARHTPVMQYTPQDCQKVQVPAGKLFTLVAIVSDADGSNAVSVPLSKITSDADVDKVTDIYAGYRIATNQPLDK